VTVQGTTLEQPPSQPFGTGFNGSLSAGTVTLGTPLANGASLDQPCRNSHTSHLPIARCGFFGNGRCVYGSSLRISSLMTAFRHLTDTN
jgi:hypothetical protein